MAGTGAPAVEARGQAAACRINQAASGRVFQGWSFKSYSIYFLTYKVQTSIAAYQTFVTPQPTNTSPKRKHVCRSPRPHVHHQP